jgi:hypothetical protein
VVLLGLAMGQQTGKSVADEVIDLLAFRRDDAKEMERVLSVAVGKPGTEGLLLSAQSDTEAFYGRLNKARDFSRRAVDSALHNDAKETAAVWQCNAALRESELGNAGAAKQQATAALAMATGGYEQALAALALARAGDAVRAQAIMEDLSKRFPADTLLNGYWLPSIRAAIEFSRNNASRSIEILRTTAHYELGTPQPFTVQGPMYPIYLRGQAYLAARNGTGAAAEFQKILAHPGVVNFPLGALAHLQLGRAYALSGDTAKAKGAYQDFLALWKDADPDIPILKEAKAEYARLQ